MPVPLTSSLVVSLAAWAGLAWLAWCFLRWLARHPVAGRLPRGMSTGLDPATAQKILACLTGTLAMLLFAALGVAGARASGRAGLQVEIPWGLLMVMLAGSAVALVAVAAFSKWKSLDALIRLSGRFQAAVAGGIWAVAALGWMGWGLTLSHGPSMEPSLPASPAIGFVDLTAYRRLPPLVGDIVTFRGAEGWAPGGYNKRVVGGPGDRFEHAFDQVWKNGRPLVACEAATCHATPLLGVSYLVLGNAWLSPPERALLSSGKVAPDHYYVLGDNLSVSGDSRSFGAVPRAAIDGKIVAILGAQGFRRVDGT